MLQGTGCICRGSLELKTDLSHLLLVYASPLSPLWPLGAVALWQIPVSPVRGCTQDQRSSVFTYCSTIQKRLKQCCQNWQWGELVAWGLLQFLQSARWGQGSPSAVGGIEGVCLVWPWQQAARVRWLSSQCGPLQIGRTMWEELQKFVLWLYKKQQVHRGVPIFMDALWKKQTTLPTLREQSTKDFIQKPVCKSQISK